MSSGYMIQKINLGRVFGYSAKEVLEIAQGLRPGKMTVAEFIEMIRGKQGAKGEKGDTPSAEEIQSAVKEMITDDIPTEDSENIVLSGGVYKGLESGVGAIDDIVEGSMRFPTSGAVWRKLKAVESHVVPIEITEPVLKTATLNGRDSFVTNSASNYVEITLPKTASEGDKYSCELCSIADSPTSVDLRVEQEEGSIVMFSSEVPKNNNAVRMDAEYSHLIWHCKFTGYNFSSKSSASTKQFATIVYSGANRTDTDEGSYFEVVPVGDNVLSTEHFKTLYGVCQIKGWTTDKEGSEVIYEPGATVTLVANQTLTLYPLYSPASVSVTSGNVLLNSIITEQGESASGSVTVKAPVSGMTSGKVDAVVYYDVYTYNDKNPNYLYFYSGSTLVKTVGSLPGGGGATHTGTVTIADLPVCGTLKVTATGSSKMRSSVKVTAYTIK